MTNDEIAKGLEELTIRFDEGWHEGITIDASDIMLLAEATIVIRNIEAAVLAEREACAKVCEHNKHRQSSHDDEYATGYVDASLDCAAAIRARGE